MNLTSTAFSYGEPIPVKYSCKGEDVSPPLAWDEPPAGTKSFALIMDDPDAPAGTWDHWVLYNIPASVTSLAEATKDHTSGITDFGKPGYGGPMPPPGHGTHYYYFWVFALKEELELEPGLTLWQLLEKIEPHTLGMNRLVGTYSRA